jgi:hypothetical protein
VEEAELPVRGIISQLLLLVLVAPARLVDPMVLLVLLCLVVLWGLVGLAAL